MARVRQQKMADERVKLVNEMLQGVRVVKLYAWEKATKAKIEASRKTELSLIRKQRICSSLFGVLLLCVASFSTVATFSVYALAGNSLRAGTVVTAHLLLTMLRFPLSFGPMLFLQYLNFQATSPSNRFLSSQLTPSSLCIPLSHPPLPSRPSATAQLRKIKPRDVYRSP